MTAHFQALDGLKVVEFGGYAAGPHVGKVMANFGAQVVHVESEDRPDGFRMQYPPYKDGIPGKDRGGCFAIFNDSKYGVTVDLKTAEGLAQARKLAEWCDVIVENMRPGVMDRLGLGYDTLKVLNPRLIMLSTCNMGQTGPRADTPGFGSQLSAFAGFCGLTGVPEGPPMLLYGPYIDFVASTLGTAAVMAALLQREETGHGVNLDLAQYESGLMFLLGPIWDYHQNGVIAERSGNDDAVAVPHGAFRCKNDQWLALSVWSEEQFASFARAIGREKWLADPRLSSPSERKCHSDVLCTLIEEWTGGLEVDQAAEILQQAGIAAYPINTMSRLFNDPQLLARHLWRRRRHPVIGDHHYEFPGFDLSATPGDIVAAAPILGQDNQKVLTEFLADT